MDRRVFVLATAAAGIPRFASAAPPGVNWNFNTHLTHLNPQTSSPIAAAFFNDALQMVYTGSGDVNLWMATMPQGASPPKLSANKSLVSNLGKMQGSGAALAAGPNKLFMMYLDQYSPHPIFSAFDGAAWESVSQPFPAPTPPDGVPAGTPPRYLSPSLALVGNTLHVVLGVNYLVFSSDGTKYTVPFGFYHATMDTTANPVNWSPLVQLDMDAHVTDCVAVNLGGKIAVAAQDKANNVAVGFILNEVCVPQTITSAGKSSPPKLDEDKRRLAAASAPDGSIFITYVGQGKSQLYWMRVAADLSANGNVQIKAASYARAGASPSIAISGSDIAVPYKGDGNHSGNVWIATGKLT